MRLQCEAECATRVKCNRPHISIRLAPPATMEDAVALCHAEKLTITDEPDAPDAALDEATRAAAKAWNVLPGAVHVVMAELDPYGAFVTDAAGRLISPFVYGCTRVAALEALAENARPKLKRVEEMTLGALLDEFHERTGATLRVGDVPPGTAGRIVAVLRAAAGVDETGKDETP